MGMKQLHTLQIKILQKLLFANGLRYSELKPSKELENNKFSFHLDQLVKEGYIQKDDAKYFLTNNGKEFANRIGTETEFKLQAKISVIVVPVRKNDSEVLLYTRLKHPFYDCQGYFSGKVYLGETVYEGALRELKEETNLSGEPFLFLILHDIVQDAKRKTLLEDKFFFCFIVREPKGELNFFEEGKFEWVKREDLRTYITKPFHTIERSLEFTNKAIKFKRKTPEFEERVSYTDKF